MLIGNELAVKNLETYINSVISTGNGTQFFILAGPNGIGKISYAKQIIQNILGNYMYSDCLFVQDYEPFIGKKHTIPVEIDKDKQFIKFPDESIHENYGVREMNVRLQNSSFSGKKFLLIENIQRMSKSAINAFLKTAEEPLQNRFIIATVPHISMIIDTIRSRSVTINFSALTNNQMEEFIKQNQIQFKDSDLKSILISMSMGKPGFLKSLYEKTQQDENLENCLCTLTKHLGNQSIPKQQSIGLLSQLNEKGLLNDFLEGWIAHCCEIGSYQQSENRIKVKKQIQSNVKLESALLYGLIQN